MTDQERRTKTIPLTLTSAVLGMALALGCGDGADTGTPINGKSRKISLSKTSVDTSESGSKVEIEVTAFALSGDEVLTVSFASDNGAEATVTPATLTFNAANYDSAQTVEIAGVDDDSADGDVSYVIETQAELSGSTSAIAVADIEGTNEDDDVAGFIVSTTTLGLMDEGESDSFTVKLSSKPSAAVNVPIVNPSSADMSISSASLSFDDSNWNVPQVVTVSTLSDASSESIEGFSISLNAATSSDSDYDGLDPANVGLAIQD